MQVKVLVRPRTLTRSISTESSVRGNIRAKPGRQGHKAKVQFGKEGAESEKVR